MPPVIVEDILDEKGNPTPGLDVDFLGADSNGHYAVDIGSNRYRYKPNTHTMDDFHKKVGDIAKYSAGKALVWVKNNATLVSKETR